MLRDIRNAEPDSEIRVKGRSFTLRKLGIEDLFFLKLDSGREKDRADLPVLARNTTLDRLTDRFNVIWKWHGSPDAVLGLADGFVSFMRGVGNAPSDVLERLDLPDSMLRNLSETWKEEGDE